MKYTEHKRYAKCEKCAYGGEVIPGFRGCNFCLITGRSRFVITRIKDCQIYKEHPKGAPLPAERAFAAVIANETKAAQRKKKKARDNPDNAEMLRAALMGEGVKENA